MAMGYWGGARRGDGVTGSLGVRVRRVRVVVDGPVASDVSRLAPERDGPVHTTGGEAAARLGRRESQARHGALVALELAMEAKGTPQGHMKYVHGQVRASRRDEAPAGREGHAVDPRVVPRRVDLDVAAPQLQSLVLAARR